MTIFRAKSSSSLVLLCAASVVLSGCGMKWPGWATIDVDPFAGLSERDRALAPEPPNMEPVNTPVSAYGDPVATTKPLELKPEGSMGSFGLKLDTYIKDDGKDVEERLERLEHAITAMHRDLRILIPAVQDGHQPSQKPLPHIDPPEEEEAPVSLVPEMMHSIADVPVKGGSHEGQAVGASQVALDALMAEKQRSSSMAVQGGIQNLPDAPASGLKTPVDQGPRAVSGISGAVITGVRVGEHADKVRIVFDSTAKVGFGVDLDNGEKLLVVEMPDAGWNLPVLSEVFPKFPVVKSYKVSRLDGNKGLIFVLQLKQATQILMQGHFPALSGGGERLVIDLKK